MIKLTSKTKIVVDSGGCVKFKAYRDAIAEILRGLNAPFYVINEVRTAMEHGLSELVIDGNYNSSYNSAYTFPFLHHFEIDVKSFCYYRELSNEYKIIAIREFRNETGCSLLYAKHAIEAITSLDFNIRNYEYCDTTFLVNVGG